MRTKAWTQRELKDWGARFSKARSDQKKLVATHAPLAASAPEVTALELDFDGIELRKKRLMKAGQLLRKTIKQAAGLTVPAEQSRQAIEEYL